MTRPRRQRYHAARLVVSRVAVEELEPRLVTGGVVNVPALAFDADPAFAEEVLLPGGDPEAGALRRERHNHPPPHLSKVCN
jgi:hypothetical protein